MNIPIVVAVAALVLLGIVRRAVGQPLQARRLLLTPAILGVVGLAQLLPSLSHMSTVDTVLLLASAAVSAGIGMVRGATVRVYAKDGVVWQRYTWVSIGVWLALIAIRIGMMALARSLDAPVTGGTQALYLMLGLSFAGEALIVLPRARALGVPFAAGRSRVTAGRD